jgi:hypothetical protein
MIVGAGLAGMIAAHVFPREEVFEAQGREHLEHRAVLRCRSPAISELTGIPFKRAIVHKGIWAQGGWSAPTPSVCNEYALKVVGRIVDRSIWDIATVERWIPPSNFHEQMVDALGARVNWDSPVSMAELYLKERDTVISTIPLSVLASNLLKCEVAFISSGIVTTSFFIAPGSSTQQTIYFPNREHGMYRATLSGDRMTCEWIGANTEGADLASFELAHAFGSMEIGDLALRSVTDFHVQAFGKLVPIDEALRKNLMVRLTNEFGIFSLGRFATWRNILLDDVLHDTAVIKLLINASEYDRKKIAHGF